MAFEDAWKLADYLPVSFHTPTEEEYIRFLWEAFESNYVAGKFQFAFLAYHMLTMSFIYFNIWQIRQTDPQKFEMGLIGFTKENEKQLLEATSPFIFSVVNESSVLRFLKLIECDNNKVGTYAKLVRDRNETAHPNGQLLFNSEATLEVKIREVLRVVEEIQTHSRATVERCYHAFLLESHDAEEREYADATDQIREALIHRNYFSPYDIAICRNSSLAAFAGNANLVAISQMHQDLVTAYPES